MMRNAKELARKAIYSVGLIEYKHNDHDLFEEVEEAIEGYSRQRVNKTLEDVKELILKMSAKDSFDFFSKIGE